MPNVRFLAAATAALVLSACLPPKREPAVLDSAAYQNGYSEGCAAAGRQNDGTELDTRGAERRTETEPHFRAGWKDGFLACGGDAFRNDRTIGTNSGAGDY